MRFIRPFFLILFYGLVAACGFAQTSQLVYPGNDGKLVYVGYANQGEIDSVNVIPDFSVAGYAGGGVALPVYPVKITLTPVSGDNRKQIQDAIDSVGNLPLTNGVRGAVLLKAGIYDLLDVLVIKKSGVVLRGEGQGLKGTVLRDLKTTQHSFITLAGSGSLTEVAGTRKLITTPYVPTGEKSFDIESTADFAVGDTIVVHRTPNQFWIDDLSMGKFGWKPEGYSIKFERKIAAISGKTITIDAPVVDPMQKRYGGGAVFKISAPDRIRGSAVENMRIESAYAKDDDENHGWNAVELNSAENCWVRQVTAVYFGYACVSIEGSSKYNTVEECAMLDPKSQITGGRRYSFNIAGECVSNLIQRCYTRQGRHDYVTGGRVPGPNVFLDCYATNTRDDIGPHHRWATGLLFDNVYGGRTRVRNRGSSGSGHGWAGAQTLFWNCYSATSDFEVASPKGGKNWGIGCIGQKQLGTGYWESWGTHIATPRSLYLRQLEDRLGIQAVNNITTEDQRKGNIWPILKAWAGMGKLADVKPD